MIRLVVSGTRIFVGAGNNIVSLFISCLHALLTIIYKCKDSKENLGWVRDTLYSYVSTECLPQRVNNRHAKNSSIFSLVVDHLCGHLPGKRADWSLSISFVASCHHSSLYVLSHVTFVLRHTLWACLHQTKLLRWLLPLSRICQESKKENGVHINATL